MKSLSISLAALFALSMMPAVAFAGDDDLAENVEAPQVETLSWADLMEAEENLPEGYQLDPNSRRVEEN